jgi:hypothetical protein
LSSLIKAASGEAMVGNQTKKMKRYGEAKTLLAQVYRNAKQNFKTTHFSSIG